MSETGERRLLSILLRGKGILNPCKTGVLDERVRCVREYGVNLFFYKKNNPIISNEKKIIHDQETFNICDVKIQCFMTPGHTKGLMCYLIDDEYLFCGDCVALSPEGGYNFMWFLNVNSKENIQSVRKLVNCVNNIQSRKYSHRIPE